MRKTEEDRKKYHRDWHRNKARQKSIVKTIDTNQIKCGVCQQIVGIKGFSKHLKIHNISLESYIDSHFDEFVQYGWVRCKICNKITKGTTCSRKCAGQYKSELYRGRPTWNKGVVMSDDYKQKLSNLRKGKPGTPHREDVKERLSKLAIDRAKQPGYKNPMLGKTHTAESIAKICKDRVGSKLELLGRKLLDSAGYVYTHQFFIVYDGRSYSYDFKLKGLPIVIELDGDYWHGGPGVKKHFFDVDRIREVDLKKEEAAKSRGYTLIRVWESDLKLNPNILIDRIFGVIQLHE